MDISPVSLELTVGAVVLAIWVDVRLAGARPTSLGRRLTHTAIAFALLQIASSLLAYVVNDTTPASTSAAMLFLVLLPTLVYAFVVGLWLLRTLNEIIG